MKYGKLITSTMSAVILSGIVSTSFGAETSKKIEIQIFRNRNSWYINKTIFE